ncbi:MAG: beta-galactosidase [Chloroflexi bacterium]|nr:beta-galactosidase [Chloroflexota bacterium]
MPSRVRVPRTCCIAYSAARLLLAAQIAAAALAGCVPAPSTATPATVTNTPAQTQAAPVASAMPSPAFTATPNKELSSILKDKTSPDKRFMYLTVWSFQLNTPGDIALYARQAKKAGFDGIGLIITWERIEAQKDKFDWQWLDECLDYVVQEDLKLALGLMFWTGGLAWNQDLCLQQTAAGETFIYDALRGPLVCLNDQATLKQVRDALRAWTEHTMQRYGDRIEKYSAHFSVFGEVEYSPTGIPIDYSPSELQAFRAVMHARDGGLEGINKDYELKLADWEEFDKMPIADLVAINDYDWQRFRLQTLVALNQLVADTIHEVAPDKLVAMQVGSVWDEAAAAQRAVYDPYLISRGVDVLHIDDAPGWPHDFSNDLTESMIPGRLLAQELDGAQHTQAIPDLYLRQARMTGESGVTIMNTANWSWQALIDWRDQLFIHYAPLFKQSPVRPLAPQNRAILYNTADFISRRPRSAQTAVLEGAYRRLSQDGKQRVRFVSDSMIVENPALLEELSAGLYLGDAAAMRFDVHTAEILADAPCPLYAESAALKLLDPFGHPLPVEIEQRLLAKIQQPS